MPKTKARKVKPIKKFKVSKDLLIGVAIGVIVVFVVCLMNLSAK